MQNSSRAAERALAVMVGLTSLGATCAPNPNEHPLGDGGGGGPVAVGFAEIEADIKMSCLTSSPACHSLTTTQNNFKIGDVRMDNYKTVKMFITDAKPEQSPLLLNAINMSTPPHTGGAPLNNTSDATYQKWLKWIKDGSIFDPTVKRVTYADIETDMAMSCLTSSPVCHGAAAASNSLKIGPDRAKNYQLVKSMYLNLMSPADSLLLKKATNQVVHTGGAALPSTTDPTYLKWLGWITDGAPEK